MRAVELIDTLPLVCIARFAQTFSTMNSYSTSYILFTKANVKIFLITRKKDIATGVLRAANFFQEINVRGCGHNCNLFFSSQFRDIGEKGRDDLNSEFLLD